jgi:CHRD domain
MRKAVLLGLVVIFGVLSVSAVALANRGKGHKNGNGKNFSARLNGWEEDPSQVTTGSGSFRATIISPTQIDFRLSYEDLETVAPANTVLFAHIHIGSRHESGGVSAFLCGGGGQPACPAGPSGSITGTIAAANIVALPAQGVEAGNFADLIRAMRKGETYANVHTATRAPGGEVRGQIRKGGKGVRDDDDDD